MWKVRDILRLIKTAQTLPLTTQEVDFLGNIWHFIACDDPRLTEKQYNYLKLIASRKVTDENAPVRVVTNGKS